MISTNKLSVIYPNGIKALKQIDLKLEQEKSYAFYGPSGSGKTTLLKCIAGLIVPTEGSVEYSKKKNSFKISMVFQQDCLFDEVSGYENVRFGCHFRNKSEEKEKILEISRLCGCQDYLDQKVSTLSGGQRQRIAIARALVSSPDLLLMDEPFTNLNPKLKSELIFNINFLQKKMGFTLIYVSHDINETIDIADVIFFMYEGKIIQEGSYELLKYSPANLTAAKYFLFPGMNVAKTKEGWIGFLPEAALNKSRTSSKDLPIKIGSLSWVQWISGSVYSAYESSFGKIILKGREIKDPEFYIKSQDLYYFSKDGQVIKEGS